MSKSKAAIYLLLIFLAGAVAGGTIAFVSGKRATPQPRAAHKDPEAFAKHLFEEMRTRLSLTPDQVQKVEPVFWAGFQEVRTIQDACLQDIENAIRKNHEQIARELTPEQRLKLEEMDRERERFLKERGGKKMIMRR